MASSFNRALRFSSGHVKIHHFTRPLNAIKPRCTQVFGHLACIFSHCCEVLHFIVIAWMTFISCSRRMRVESTHGVRAKAEGATGVDIQCSPHQLQRGLCAVDRPSSPLQRCRLQPPRQSWSHSLPPGYPDKFLRRTIPLMNCTVSCWGRA